MVKGKTSTGFEFNYDERILDDYALLEAIGRFDESNSKVSQVKALTDMIDYILGESKQKFMEHIADKNDGFRPIEAMKDELVEIITASKNLKNSPSSHG